MAKKEVKKEVKEQPNPFEEVDKGVKPGEKAPVEAQDIDSADEEYDINNLDSRSIGEKYVRQTLDGQTVTIEKATIKMPASDATEKKSMDGKFAYKDCEFVVHYDTKNKDRERYSGLKIWKQDNGWSKPVIGLKGKNQATTLVKTYAAFKKKDPKEVSMKEFFSFLNSKPKAVLKYETITYGDKEYQKNMIVSFVD